MSDTLGERLRNHREQRHIALSTIAEDTKIKASLLEALERDDLSRWPTGIFRRAFVRAYARAVGLDGEVILQELLVLHPDPSMPSDHDSPSDEAHASTKPAGSHLELGRLAPPRPADPVVAASPSRVELDLVAAAAVCSRLAQLEDGSDLEPVLAEMTTVVGARGIVVWRWRSDAARLVAAAAAGYERAVIERLPGVRREADNATAAAFRSAQMTIVEGGESRSGAIAVPSVSAYGVVAVLAIELPGGRERETSVQATATIWAAQLVGVLSGAIVADERTRVCG